MKAVLKILGISLLGIALVFGGFMYLLAGRSVRVKTNIQNYEKDLEGIGNAAQFMPELDTLGNYTDIEYRYQITITSRLVGFISDGYALFVTYDKGEYKQQKDRILSGYSFLEKPVAPFTDDLELPVTEFDYKGYHIKIVPDEEYIDYCACKSFMMIGFDDASSTIVYMYYYDFDLDYIAEVGDDYEEEMREFVDNAFSWKK